MAHVTFCILEVKSTSDQGSLRSGELEGMSRQANLSFYKSSSELSVESNQAITLVFLLVLLRFEIS